MFEKFEDAAMASKKAWDAGDFHEAARCFGKKLAALWGEKGRVRQEPDGHLIVRPWE